MIQIPNAVGLLLYEKAIVEEGTKRVTLVNTYTRLQVARLPSPPQQLLVHAMLTDGLGMMPLSLVILRLDTLENIVVESGEVSFSSPLDERRLYYRVNAVRFPVAGRYQITLLANWEWVAQCTLTIIAAED
jgi:hypothetical protein